MIFAGMPYAFMMSQRLARGSESKAVVTADFTIIMSRTLQVTANRDKFTRFLLLPVSEEAKT